MIVSSGTAGHAHAYWTLRTRVEAAELEQANRTLASHLGGDLASVDAARILRPAGTLSHKHRPPAPVELLHRDAAARYELAELVDGITPARVTTCPRPQRARTRAARTELDELLLAIPAATYVRELTGREPRRNGKVNCPFHADETPSLQLYDGRHLLLLRLRRRRQHLRLRRNAVEPRDQGALVPKASRATRRLLRAARQRRFLNSGAAAGPAAYSSKLATSKSLVRRQAGRAPHRPQPPDAVSGTDAALAAWSPTPTKRACGRPDGRYHHSSSGS